MKSFMGDMHDYILESSQVVRKVIENRQVLVKGFVDYFNPDECSAIHITGAGTSCFSGHSARRVIERLLRKKVVVHYPVRFVDSEMFFDQGNILIAISATGSSVSTIRAVDKAKERGFYTFAATNDMDGEIAKHADDILFLDYGVEDVSPKSKSYIVEMTVLMLCALEAAKKWGYLTEEQYENRIEQMLRTADNLTPIAEAADRWYDLRSEEMKQARRILVIGYDDNFGNIQEGALKILENARFGVAWYELEEFMHGIYHSIDQDCYMIYLMNESPYAERILRLKDYCSEKTIHNFVIGNVKSGLVDGRAFLCDFVEDQDFYAMEYIIPLQIISYRLARDLGINPNRPSDPLFHQKMASKV